MLDKLKDGLFKARAYWRRPPKGYDVSYKEIVNLSLGLGGISFLSILMQWTALSTGIHMMISYFKVSTGLVWLFGLIAAVLALIRAPILSMIIDNSNSSKGKGKFKPYIIWTSIICVLTYGVIPYIPNAWNTIQIISVQIPAIPIMGVKVASTINISLAVMILFIMLQIGAFFVTLLMQAFAGIEQTISTVAQERANIGAIKGLLCNIPSSVVNILLPILAGILFANSGHMLNINLYRIVFPFCAVGTVGLIFFTYYGTKERVVVNKKYKAKVSFSEGAKLLSSNKYFWIITMFNSFMGLRFLANITNWITQFSFYTPEAKTLAGIYCSTILMNVLILGMVLGPMLIKKFGKKKVLHISNISFTLMVLFQFIVHKNPYLVLFAALLQNIFNGFIFITAIMVSDIMDYVQWETGKRLEGFWHNYSGFVTTIIGVLIGVLLPLFLSFGGIGFGDDYNVVMQNTLLRDNAYKYQTLLALIGSVLCIIPIMFYDLTEDKHAQYVKVLKIRAAVDNYSDEDLLDKDVLNVKCILDYVGETKDEFVQAELSKYDCIDKIIENYDDVILRVEAGEALELKEELARDIELEEKKLKFKLDKAKKKAHNSGLNFDEEDFTRRFIENSRYIKLKDIEKVKNQEDIK